MQGVWLVKLCICLLLLSFSIGQECQTPGWFGERCQFMCHCQNNVTCDNIGDCPSVCEGGWFGPQCQYLDLASGIDALTDGDIGSCLDSGSPMYTLSLFTDVRFTWMRLITKESGKLTSVSITFLTSNDSQIQEQSPLKHVVVNPNVLDIHGSLESRVRKIQLIWNSSQDATSFCSVHVSGDGDISQVFSSQTFCTHTLEAPLNYWTLQISPPVDVDRYLISNREGPDGENCRLQYFRLESSDGHSTQTYNDKSPQAQSSYEIFLPKTMNVTSVNISVSTDFWPGEFDCKREHFTYLTLCEVQVFGESECEPGKWGRQCEKACDNCKVPTESCYVPTGICPSGCKPGYQGVGCEQVCDEGYWGSECTNQCSVHCADGDGRLCDKENGYCTHRCKLGYWTELCDQPCENGTWGAGCENQCGEHCAGDGLCDKENGNCIHGCKSGYRFDLCEQFCYEGYWGFGCRNQCSVHCDNDDGRLCNAENGHCTFGCNPGYWTELCDQSCENGTWGAGCENQCSEQCAGDGLCHKKNGTCTHGCKPGYRFDLCEERCEEGYWGIGCSQNCTEICDGICNNVNGTCVQECKPDYNSDLCQQNSTGDDDKTIAFIVVPIALVVIASIIVIGCLYLRRRRRANSNRPVEDVRDLNQRTVDHASGLTSTVAETVQTRELNSSATARPETHGYEYINAGISNYDMVTTHGDASNTYQTIDDASYTYQTIDDATPISETQDHKYINAGILKHSPDIPKVDSSHTYHTIDDEFM